MGARSKRPRLPRSLGSAQPRPIESDSRLGGAIGNDRGVSRRQEMADREKQVELGARLKERSSAKRKLLVSRLLVAFGVLAVVGVGTWVFGFSSLTGLDREKITIEGLEGEGLGQAVALVDEYQGVPLLRVPRQQIEEDLAKQPGIRQASVVRAWPRGITVDAVARDPVMVSKSASGYQLVGEDGVTVSQTRQRPEELMSIEVSGVDDAEQKRALRADAYTVWQGLPKELFQEVVALTATPAGVVLVLEGDRRVIWGSVEDSGYKAEVAGLLLESRSEAVIDVSEPSAPSAR